MSNITLGKIIEKLRIEKNYSRRQLCKGLCSMQMLIKIETDQSDVDKFLADILSQLLDEDWNQAESYIRQAIEMTLPEVTAENINEYLLSTVELENILELGYLMFMQGRVQEAEWIFEACYRYIEDNVTDGVENTKLTSKNAWLSSLVYIKRKEYKKAFKICQEAFEKLRKYGNLYFMIPILQQLITCCDAMDMERDGKDYKNYYNILNSLYEEYGENWYCHNSIFHNCSLTVYHLASEFIRQERHARNMTQEQLIEGVYEVPENLSRVEGGKVSPTRKKFEGLMKNLGIERGKYCGTLAVEDFEILELKYEMDILIGTGKYDEAEEKLSELKNMIDCDDGMNAMAIEIYQISLELSRELIAGEMRLKRMGEELKKLLETSGLLINGKIYRVPFFNEMTALNMLAICLKRTGNQQEAIDAKYQNDILSLVLANLDLYNQKREGVRKGIAYELMCGKGKALHMHMVAMLGLEDNKNAKQDKTRMAYYLSEIFYIETNRQQLKSYYEKTFGRQISS